MVSNTHPLIFFFSGMESENFSREAKHNHTGRIAGGYVTVFTGFYRERKITAR